jgi:putative hydrolase
MEGAPPPVFFANLTAMPDKLDGVWLLRGVELNVIDYDGKVDLDRERIGKLDWVIASMHVVTLEPSSRADHTRGWLAIAENPDIDVIGHCGDPRFEFDVDQVVPVWAKYKKIVEINTHSFKGRPGSLPVCERVARLCAEQGVPVVISSDAHFHDRVGDFDAAISLLQSISFPEELILNADYDRFAAVITAKSGRAF